MPVLIPLQKFSFLSSISRRSFKLPSKPATINNVHYIQARSQALICTRRFSDESHSKETKSQSNSSNTNSHSSKLPKKSNKFKWLKILVGLTGGVLAGVFLFIEAQSFQNQDTGIYETSKVPGLFDSYYSRTVKETVVERPSLNTSVETDVCVIGGGLTGLATAIGLAERGKKVVVLEGRRIGWGASGLNGGFAISGFQIEEEIIDLVGPELAKELFSMTVEAQGLLRRRIEENQIKCDVEDVGTLTVSYIKNGEEESKKEIEHVNQVLQSSFEVWPKEKIQELYKTPFYQHGVFDPTSFTVHPLNLVLGLARVAEQKGVKIYENTKAVSLTKTTSSTSPTSTSTLTSWNVSTGDQQGRVVSKDVVLAGAAHLDSGVDSVVARAVVPVYTYIIVTEPLGDKLKDAIRANHAVCDDRFALNYFRPLPDGRLLWGGLAQTYPVAPSDVAEVMKKDLLRVFPQLEGVKVETAWGGAVAFGAELMPLIGKRDEGLWYCTGFGGHGIVPTTLGGELIASAIANGDQRWKIFSDNFHPQWVGGIFGKTVAQLTYWSYILYDEYNILMQKLTD